MQNADRVAFDLFYAENSMPAYRFALRLSGDKDDAEDLVAQAFGKAFRSWAQYRGRSESRTWLLAIVRNEWRMLCRRRPHREERLDAVELIAETLTQRNVELAEAICSLPDPLREAFLLVKGEGLTHSEAAKVVRVPLGTLSSRVHEALHRLRKELVSKAELDLSEKVIYRHEMS